MKLRFLGAAQQVTGSRYCLEAGGLKVLVDCGLFQEREFLGRNWAESPVPPEKLDALVLTHAHVDHCGLIPRLGKQGFNNRILATSATVDLAEIILRDAAKIQTEDAAYKKRRHKKEGRKGKYPEVPLYTVEDVERVLPLFQTCPYGKPVPLNEHVSVTFHDAGHILGSAMLQFDVQAGDSVRKIVFSGDIGQWDKPILRDPHVFREADWVVMESTYGDRDHEDHGDIASQLERVINDTVGRGGHVVIPTFAVERAQELMYYVGELAHEDRIPDVPIYLDSPMAVNATAVFRRHRDCFDQETWHRIADGQRPFHFPGLRLARSTEDSMAINELREPAIIMSTSGMCTAGRIKHHLRRNITRPECTVLFVGYQAQGTLGRQILDGKKEVRIHGRQWPVRAQIAQIYGFSGHADRGGLLHWLSGLKAAPRNLFLTHGEEDSARALAEQIEDRFGYQVSVPHYQEVAKL